MVRRRPLLDEVLRRFPDLLDAEKAIRSGRVTVAGSVRTNPASQVSPSDPIRVAPERTSRGRAKLQAALDAFDVQVAGRVALDLGASTGGFSSVLLDAGATRVYAVDVGFGQLLGSLRMDSRVVNLERTNLAELSTDLVPEGVGVVTADLSYVALAQALPQVPAELLPPDAGLIVLVKAMFELHLSTPPTEPEELASAVQQAEEGARAAGWEVCDVIESPVTGAHGAVEFLLFARRARQ